jgi:xanthine dehydrogenase accessory factor
VNSLLIDSREDELALADPAIDQDLTPFAGIAHSRRRPGSAFVMLTHDHALDFLLTREALARSQTVQDVAYVGMIGSKTKRATFARWLEKETGSRVGPGPAHHAHRCFQAERQTPGRDRRHGGR